MQKGILQDIARYENISFVNDAFLIQNVDDTDANNVYIGTANVGTADADANWVIVKWSTDGGGIKRKRYAWVDATTIFRNVWNNRASLTYK